MDTLTPNNCSKSSGSSATSSSMDLGDRQPSCKQTKQRQRSLKLSRSRSLLQLLSRHFGKHFHHHHHQEHPHHIHQKDMLYSSQDDVRSSSTDSFSLSYERGSRNECLEVLHGGSSLDLENTSRTSSTSYSPGMEFYDNNAHIYVETVYRPGSAMDQLQGHYDDSSSVDEEDEEEEEDVEHVDENENLNVNLDQLKPNDERQQRSGSAASASSSRSTHKTGLHLSRISISSSVSRVLQHFSTSAATTATASLRSLSCSSTPLKQLRTQREMSSTMPMTKKSLTPHNSSSSNSSSNSSCSSHHNSNNSSTKSSKKDKKQQSILRPPVQYVYMKGMSGLYSRVPSYAVCCPYTLHHMY